MAEPNIHGGTWRLWDVMDDHCPCGERCYLFRRDPDDARGIFHVPVPMFHGQRKWPGKKLRRIGVY